MNSLIDTNVILDVLCNRKDFVEASAKVWKYCETGIVNGYISALSIPNIVYIVYILRKELDAQKTKEVIERISLIFSIVDLTAEDLKKAADIGFEDYEDALQSVCSERIKANYIVTRNIRDFSKSSVPAVSPAEFITIVTKRPDRF